MKVIFFVILLFGFIVGCRREQVFDGSRTSNDTQFVMEYDVLNGTKTHEMELEEGTMINVIVQNDSGQVNIAVEDSHGEVVYQGGHASSTNFTFGISSAGRYTFTVTGSKAKGGVSVKVVES
ncbi:MAG: hypothetical protein LRY71_16830 [Bacillaceae bacterium]|nr:hypothetical protein [Bacillaceae bacterium]